MALTDRTEGKTQVSQTSTAGENARYATPRVAQSKTTCPGSAGWLLEARIAGAAPGADARNFQSCTRSLSQQPFTSPGRVLGDLPSGVVVVNSYMISAAQSARRIVVNSHQLPRRRQSREPLPVKPPRACLVKPVAAWADFLGLRWDSPMRGLRLQPAATGRPGRTRRAQGWAHGHRWRI